MELTANDRNTIGGPDEIFQVRANQDSSPTSITFFYPISRSKTYGHGT
jgi:hypothetical protein